MKLDIEQSKAIADKVDIKPKECFRNALIALSVLPDNAIYVEGYCVSQDDALLIEHGWIELDDSIIDPTLYQTELAGYFAGLKISKSDIVQRFRRGAIELPLWVQADSHDMRTAQDNGLKFCSDLLQAKAEG